MSGATGDGCATAERRDADHVPHRVGRERLCGGAGEPGVRGVQTRRPRVWRSQPEDGVRAGEGPIDDLGVVVRAGDDVDAGTDRVGEFCGVAHDDAQFFATSGSLIEQGVQEPAADPAGGGGDDDHVSSLGAARLRRPIPFLGN